MKLELLASVLETDKKELASTLKLEEGVEEVSPEIAKLEIVNHIASLKIASKKKYTAEGEGKAERLHKLNTEKRLKELGIEGDKYDDMFSNLATKLTNKPDDDSLTKALNAFKLENISLKGQLKTIEENKILNEKKANTKKKVLAKISEVLKQYSFPSEEAKSVAIENFIAKSKFVLNGEDIFLEKGDKVETSFDESATKHFSLFGTVEKKPNDKKKVPTLNINSTTYKGTLAELNKMMINATTMEEKTAIKAKIKEKLAETS